MYYPFDTFPPSLDGCGTMWTEDFWADLGLGWTVNQAANMATDSYSGFMANYLYVYGDWDTNWLYR